jgi:hypothetical protein
MRFQKHRMRITAECDHGWRVCSPPPFCTFYEPFANVDTLTHSGTYPLQRRTDRRAQDAIPLKFPSFTAFHRHAFRRYTSAAVIGDHRGLRLY